MKTGDFVYVHYVGRIKDTGEVFDVTIEEVAKKEGIFNPRMEYGPVPIVVDAGFVIPGLNEAVKDMKVGEKKKVEIPCEKGFGERDEGLIRVFPISVFKERNIDVSPGKYIVVNNLKGKIMSVDGGRVKIDFNHPLAGKTLEYEIEVVGKIESVEEKIKAILYFFIGSMKDVEVTFENGRARIRIKKALDIPRSLKQRMFEEIKKWVKDVKSVEFVDVFE